MQGSTVQVLRSNPPIASYPFNPSTDSASNHINYAQNSNNSLLNNSRQPTRPRAMYSALPPNQQAVTRRSLMQALERVERIRANVCRALDKLSRVPLTIGWLGSTLVATLQMWPLFFPYIFLSVVGIMGMASAQSSSSIRVLRTTIAVIFITISLISMITGYIIFFGIPTVIGSCPLYGGNGRVDVINGSCDNPHSARYKAYMYMSIILDCNLLILLPMLILTFVRVFDEKAGLFRRRQGFISGPPSSIIDARGSIINLMSNSILGMNLQPPEWFKQSILSDEEDGLPKLHSLEIVIDSSLEASVQERIATGAPTEEHYAAEISEQEAAEETSCTGIDLQLATPTINTSEHLDNPGMCLGIEVLKEK